MSGAGRVPAASTGSRSQLCRHPRSSFSIVRSRITLSRSPVLPSHDVATVDYHPTHWSPSTRLGVLWNVLGGVLTLAGILGFAAIAALNGVDPFRPMTVGNTYVSTGITLLILGVMLALHELTHGAVMRQFGAEPRYGAALVGRVMPVIYCSAVGATFTREQYALAAITPVIAISLVGASLIAIAPFGAWLVVPLGLHFGGAVGDFWATALMLRQPRGTLIEDTEGGIILHRPTTRAGQ